MSKLSTLPNWNDLADSSLAGELLREQGVRLRTRLCSARSAAAAYRVRWHYWEIGCATLPPQRAERSVPRGLPLHSGPKKSLMEIEKYHYLLWKNPQCLRADEIEGGTFCMVISGRTPTESNFTKVLDAVREVKAKYDLKSAPAWALERRADATLGRVQAGVTKSQPS